jgi:integrase
LLRGVRRADWVLPASTRSGHIEKSTLKKQHKKALKLSKVEAFTLYTLRHTCLTRSSHMDAYTLAYLAGHADFATTKRYIHPRRKLCAPQWSEHAVQKVGIVTKKQLRRRLRQIP